MEDHPCPHECDQTSVGNFKGFQKSPHILGSLERWQATHILVCFPTCLDITCQINLAATTMRVTCRMVCRKFCWGEGGGGGGRIYRPSLSLLWFNTTLSSVKWAQVPLIFREFPLHPMCTTTKIPWNFFSHLEGRVGNSQGKQKVLRPHRIE